MLPTPTKFALSAGIGEGTSPLTAFDAALLESGFGNLNLLKVSSILPPQAEYHERLFIPPGSLVPTAYSKICSSKPGEQIAAAVAVGIPVQDTFGVIMECSDFCSKEELEERIRGMVTEAFVNRRLALKEIKVCAVEHTVVNCGSAFAGLALWY